MIRVTDEGINPVMTSLGNRLVVAWQKRAGDLAEIWASTYTSIGELEAGPYPLFNSSIVLNGGDLDVGLAPLSSTTFAAAIIAPHDPANPTVPNRDVVVVVSSSAGVRQSSLTTAHEPSAIRNRQNPAIAATSELFAVVWSVHVSNNVDISGQRFSLCGQKIDGVVRVSSDPVGETATKVTAIPTGFAVTWNHHGPKESRLRIFDHLFTPKTTPIRIGNGFGVVNLARGPDRLLAVWPESGVCLGRFFNFTAFPLTDIFAIANDTGQAYWPHATFFDGRYMATWTEWSDDSIHGRWLTETGSGEAAFLISPQPANVTAHPNAFPVSFDTGTAVAWENAGGIELQLFTRSQTSSVPTTSLPCPPCSQLLTTMECNCPTLTTGETITFVPVPAGLPGAGIAGWVVSGILLAITLGLSALLLTRKQAAPSTDEEEQPRSHYSSLPPTRPSDGSHYVGMDVINPAHDQAIKEATALLIDTGHQVIAPT